MKQQTLEELDWIELELHRRMRAYQEMLARIATIRKKVEQDK